MDASPFQVVIRSPILRVGQEAAYLDAFAGIYVLSGLEMVSWDQQRIARALSSQLIQSRNREAFESSRLTSGRLVRMRRRREYLIEVADSREPKLCAASRRRAGNREASAGPYQKRRLDLRHLSSARLQYLCHQRKGRLTVVCRPCSRAPVARSPDHNYRITSSTHNPAVVDNELPIPK